MQPSGDEANYVEELDAIFNSDLPDMEKMARAFGGLTAFIIDEAQGQIELAKAMHDGEETVKQQVKMETMKHARKIFQTCHRRITGRGAWDE
jgi:hypothetical protein